MGIWMSRKVENMRYSADYSNILMWSIKLWKFYHLCTVSCRSKSIYIISLDRKFVFVCWRLCNTCRVADCCRGTYSHVYKYWLKANEQIENETVYVSTFAKRRDTVNAFSFQEKIKITRFQVMYIRFIENEG